jgi:DNA-binding NarL/FixJ family response regulator
MTHSVWLIEDNVAFCHTMERVLRRRADVGMVRSFVRCEDALEVIAAGDAPGVIFLDVGLPGIDGIEGISRIKSLAPEVSILVLTVFEDDDKIFRAVCAGASGYLLKGGPMQNVLEAMEQVLAGGSPMNPRVARRVLEMFARQNGGRIDYGLNPREITVLEAMVHGLIKKQIADKLDLNLHTVNYVIRCIYRKLHVNRVTEAVTLAMKDGLITRPTSATPPQRVSPNP